MIAGIIVTGMCCSGASVELIREDGTTCTLPPLPQAMHGHTQVGLEACGGLDGYGDGSEYLNSCVTFSAGTWATSHTLAVSRTGHVSWASYPGGVLLLGGWDRAAQRSTELLSSTSSTTTPQFSLAYETR